MQADDQQSRELGPPIDKERMLMHTWGTVQVCGKLLFCKENKKIPCKPPSQTRSEAVAVVVI